VERPSPSNASAERTSDDANRHSGLIRGWCHDCLDALEGWLPTGVTGLSAFVFELSTMRAPVDLQAMTREIKNRCARATGNLEQITQIADPIFAQPRDVMLELVMARHQIEAAMALMQRGWWP
jgi:hypothetical protein